MSRGGSLGQPSLPEGCHGVHHRRALEAAFAAIHGISTRFLSSTRCLRYAAIDRDVREIKTDGSVVGSRAICSKASITPASIHSSRLRLRVVAEHPSSAIRQ